MDVISRRRFDHLDVSLLRVPGGPARPLGDDPWLVRLIYCLAGSASVSIDEQRLALEPTTMSVLPPARAVVARGQDDCRLLVLSMPQSAIGPDCDVLLAGAGRTWTTRDGSGPLVVSLLEALAEGLERLVSDNAGRLSQHIVGLITVMFADADRTSTARDTDVTIGQVRWYIEDNLADADLSPDEIARAHSISTRTLRRLFEAEGETVSGWIRQRRMERCRLDLIDAASAALPVSSIGARWGMWDAAHFSRLFKAWYGISPRALRTAHRAVSHVQVHGGGNGLGTQGA